MFFFFIDPNEMPVFGRGLETCEYVLDRLCAVHPGIPVGAASALVHVGRRLPPLAGGSMNLADVARQMGVNYTTFLRHTDVLADGAARTRRLGLIEKGISSVDRRTRKVRLTSEGLGLLRDLDRIASAAVAVPQDQKR